MNPSPFDPVANPAAAHRSLTPAAVEQQLRRYLERLGGVLAESAYTPIRTAHALVFGEWGHGKSQVTYRVDAFLRSQLPVVWTIRVVPERLTPTEVLRAAADVARDAKIGAGLRDARAAVRELGEGTDAAAERAAVALAQAAIAHGTAHTCLLLDEAATMREGFQYFLSELLTEFTRARVHLHVLQCHSLASLDSSLTIADRLGDRFLQASRIFLPSIRIDQAYEFFRARLAETPGYERRAGPENPLVPPGVAATLCQAAGGNPRRMLQYAFNLHAAAGGGADAKTFDGGLVCQVFANEPGLERNSRLYQKEALTEVLGRLRQLLPTNSTLPKFLEEQVPAMFGESRRFSAAELSQSLATPLTRLAPAVAAPVGFQLFAIETSAGDTTYGLSADFRRRLSNALGYSGDLPLREAQHRVLLSPVQQQPQIADGLRSVCGHGLSRKEQLAELGRVDGVTLRGYAAEVDLPGTTERIPVLVTGFIGDAVPGELVREVVRGLIERPRRWLRAFILLHARRELWDSWLGSEVGRATLEPLGDHQDRLQVLGQAEWGDLMAGLPDPGGESSGPGVQAARLFAALVHAPTAYRDAADPGPELRAVYDGLRGLLEARLPTLAEVFYPPTPAELDILRHAAWGGFGSPWHTLTLGALADAGAARMTAAQIGRMVPTFLRPTGRGYQRVDPQEAPFHQAVLGILKRNRSELLTPRQVTEAAEAEHLFAWPSGIGGLTDRIERVVGWVLEEWVRLGHARTEDGRFGYEDIAVKIRRKKQELTRGLSRCRQAIKSVTRFGWHAAVPGSQPAADLARIGVELRELDAAVKADPGVPAEFLRRLEQLTPRVTTLGEQVGGLRRQADTARTEALADPAFARQGLGARLAALSPEWQALVVSPSNLSEWDDDYAELSRRVTSATSEAEEAGTEDGAEPITYAELAREAAALSHRSAGWLDLFDAVRPLPADPRQKLLAVVARGFPCQGVTVRWTEERK